MELKEGQLRVYYGGGEIDAALDEALEEALAKHGYRRWASGFNLVDDVRDLAFDRVGEKECA